MQVCWKHVVIMSFLLRLMWHQPATARGSWLIGVHLHGTVTCHIPPCRPGHPSAVTQPPPQSHTVSEWHSQRGMLGSHTSPSNPDRPPVELHPHVIFSRNPMRRPRAPKLVSRETVFCEQSHYADLQNGYISLFSSVLAQKVPMAFALWSTCWRYPVQIPLGHKLLSLWEIWGCHRVVAEQSSPLWLLDTEDESTTVLQPSVTIYQSQRFNIPKVTFYPDYICLFFPWSIMTVSLLTLTSLNKDLLCYIPHNSV